MAFLAVYTTVAAIIGAEGRSVPAALSLAYMANWARISGEPFYELGHMWSLAVEEQFYVIWPLVIIAAHRWASRPVVWIGALLGLSILWRALVWHQAGEWLHTYHGTDTVASSLLFGALAAHLRVRVTARAAGLAAALIGVLALGLNQHENIASFRPAYAYVWVTVIGAAAMVMILGAEHLRWLTAWPLRMAGMISYGWYLWHVVALKVVQPDVYGDPRPVHALVAVLASLGIALASYRWVEAPWRSHGTGCGSELRPSGDEHVAVGARRLRGERHDEPPVHVDGRGVLGHSRREAFAPHPGGPVASRRSSKRSARTSPPGDGSPAPGRSGGHDRSTANAGPDDDRSTAPTRPARWIVAPIVAALLIAACSDSGDEAAPTTTEERTTTTLSPIDAFDEAIAAQLTSDDPTLASSTRDVAQGLCSTLEGLASGPAEDDAGPDTPQSDAAISDTMITMGIAASMEGFADQPAVGAIILRAAGEHLCPAFRADIESLLAAGALGVPGGRTTTDPRGAAQSTLGEDLDRPDHRRDHRPQRRPVIGGHRRLSRLHQLLWVDRRGGRHRHKPSNQHVPPIHPHTHEIVLDLCQISERPSAGHVLQASIHRRQVLFDDGRVAARTPEPFMPSVNPGCRRRSVTSAITLASVRSRAIVLPHPRPVVVGVVVHRYDMWPLVVTMCIRRPHLPHRIAPVSRCRSDAGRPRRVRVSASMRRRSHVPRSGMGSHAASPMTRPC